MRIKYVLDHNGDYIEAERYGNEVVKDPNGIMPDKPDRYRPTKEKGEKLFYSPSIRQERVDTLRRICEMFAEGWTTYKIAQQLNTEGNKPVHGDRWYSAVIDGLFGKLHSYRQADLEQDQPSKFSAVGRKPDCSRPTKIRRGNGNSKTPTVGCSPMRSCSTRSFPWNYSSRFKPNWKPANKHGKAVAPQ